MRGTTTISIAGLAALLLGSFAAWAGQSAERNPLAPAQQQVQARFDTIQREIDRLMLAGQSNKAYRMAEKLQYFRDELAGSMDLLGDAPELHVVGVYEGQYAGGVTHSANNHPTGTASVSVEATGRPMVLALNAYEPVNWQLQIGQGVRLEGVYISGYYEQTISGLPESVPVIKTSAPAYAYAKDYSSYPRLARSLYSESGLAVSTLVGSYAFQGQPFQVGPGSADWRAQRVLTDMQDLYQQATAYERAQQRKAVQPLRFTGLLRVPSEHSPMATAIAEMTPFGPVLETIQPLPTRIEHLAVDPATQTYYGTYNHAVYQLDPGTGAMIEMPLADLSWPCGLTFDTKRNRLVLSSLGGEGFFYSYSPEEQTWSVLTSLNNIDLQSLTYLAADDSLYGLTTAWGGSVPQLLHFSSDGSLLGTIETSQPIPVGYYAPQWGYQLFAVDDRLALITPPVPDLYAPQQESQIMSMIIDPRTGEVTYAEAIGEVTDERTVDGNVTAAAITYVPEPGAAMVLGAAAVMLLRRSASGARTRSQQRDV